MKKLFAISLLTASFLSSAALAKTEGSYVGIDLVNTNVKFYEKFTNNANKTTISRVPSFSGSAYGGGVHYNYAFNINGLFIAPGLIAEQNSATADAYGTQEAQRIEILNRYGVKTDIGYDLTDRFAAYATGGYVGISYRTRNFVFSDGTGTSIKNGTQGDWFYGAGLKFDCDKNISVRLEYNTQSFLAKTSTQGSLNNLVSHYKTKVDVVKVGMSYRF